MLSLLLVLINCIDFKYDHSVKTNVLVMGQKSSCKELLINELFHENIIPLDNEKKSAETIQFFKRKGFPLAMYNTPGLDFNSNRNTKIKQKIINFVKRQSKTDDLSQYVHCILYCVKSTAYRLDEKEINFLRDFTNDPNLNNISVIVVIIQNDRTSKTNILRKNTKMLNLNVFDVVSVIIKKNVLFLPLDVSYGYDTLFDAILNGTSKMIIENSYKFYNKTLKYKRVEASLAISTAVLLSSAVGYKEIPAQSPIHLVMLKTIQAIYGVKAPKNFVTGYVKTMLGKEIHTIFHMFKANLNNNTESIKNQTKSFFSLSGIWNHFTAKGKIAATKSGATTAIVGAIYVCIMEKAFKEHFDLNLSPTEIEKLIEPFIQEEFFKKITDWIENEFL